MHLTEIRLKTNLFDCFDILVNYRKIDKTDMS